MATLASWIMIASGLLTVILQIVRPKLHGGAQWAALAAAFIVIGIGVRNLVN